MSRHYLLRLIFFTIGAIALLRKGIRKYNYIVDLGEQTLIATTYETPGNNYQTNKQILNRMMKTIEFSDWLATNN